MVQVERDLWRWSCPITLLRQGHLEPVSQDSVQVALEYLHEWGSCNLPGQPVPVFDHPHSKKVFSDVHTEPPVFLFLSIASCPVTGCHWKVSDPVWLAQSFLVFISTDKVPPALLFSRLNSPDLSAFP